MHMHAHNTLYHSCLDCATTARQLGAAGIPLPQSCNRQCMHANAFMIWCQVGPDDFYNMHAAGLFWLPQRHVQGPAKQVGEQQSDFGFDSGVGIYLPAHKLQ